MKKEVRIKETEKVMDRISALESVAKVPAAKGINGEPMHVFQKDEIIEEILNEYVKRYTYLEGAKEYMVHFEGGGWNTCYGRDEEEALVNAIQNILTTSIRTSLWTVLRHLDLGLI